MTYAMRANGWDVSCYQEGDDDALPALLHDISNEGADFVLWTSTKSLRDNWGHAAHWQLLAHARKHNTPVIAYHLDRWAGLKRESSLLDPYFQCDLVVTADGGNDDVWPTYGIRHRWLPPGVSEKWCQPGMFRDEYACDVMFVGSWQDYGHREWQHRGELINNLSRWYGDRLLCLPRLGQPAVRGLELNDAYWSAKVVVGDSCLVPRADGTPITRYCSDRIPETMGRGGVLAHPLVEGINDREGDAFSCGYCETWPLGDWKGLRRLLDQEMLDWDESTRLNARQENIDFIRAYGTYTVRMRQLAEILVEEGLLS